MQRVLRKIAQWAGLIVAGLVVLYLVAATALALAPSPKLTYANKPSPSAPAERGGSCRASAGIRCFPMRDDALLAARQLGSLPVEKGGLIVVLLHGVMSSSGELKETAQRLRESTGAVVLRLDLRGHGLSTGGHDEKPGDIAHIGQWEEDVADVISALRKESPSSRIVLAGHSMGGGIAMRYALRHKERRDVPDVDGYLLFAPHLGDKSPTTRKEPAADPKIAKSGKSGKSEPPQIIKINVPRLIGLALLNVVGITQLNGLDTLYFDLPFDLPFRAYSFRAVASMAPDDYRTALAADAKPMLVLVGENDEAFVASQYPAVVALHRNSKTVIIQNETHDGIFRNPAAFAAIHDWIGAV
ncbi:MAG TPA: alpha/beta fold hydrolase [Thermoanaerobaculia bacterium]|jgi:pimeloyl-ACP methyl ester carboxylesterase|nr:alpha/beta fold hydrolase [Thermoanaerobaculia bacterium]